MWPNPQFPADLVTFTEEILNGKLHFLWGVIFSFLFIIFIDFLSVKSNLILRIIQDSFHIFIVYSFVTIIN